MSKTYMATTAEQLGAYPVGSLNGKDLNNVSNGVYVAEGNCTNLPSPAEACVIYQYGRSDASFITQIAIKDGSEKMYFRNKYVLGTWQSWIELADAANFLPLDGSVAMTGELFINNGTASLTAGEGATISHRPDKSWDNYIQLVINATNLQTALKLLDANGGIFNIFGEHNTQLLAAPIEKLIREGKLNTLDNAIQAYTGDAKNGVDFSVTGKGRIFLSNNGVSILKPTITVDGKSIGNVSVVGSGSSIYVEFLNSCKVTNPSTDILKCTAVCY